MKICPLFVSFFDLQTVRGLVSDARNSISEQIMDIEYKISSKRQMAKMRREDQVLRYQEAITIARTLGIKKRVDATNIIQNTQMNVDIATASTPLYYLGIEALSAEISILQNRKSDDPFISGLRDLQEQLALLRSIKITEIGMHSVTIDQAAYPPKNRIKPNRRLIVSVGTVVGLFLGIFLVFFFSFVQKLKETHSV
jgi:chain length determinant protein (polysaccharide antigen chain regulator)